MPTRHAYIDRATFLRRASGLMAIAMAAPAGLLAMPDESASLEHPEPREGITSERVLTVAALGTVRDAQVLDAYDAARTYPAIFDGVACGCSCGGTHPMHRSLLVCYETTQPTGCVACQLEAATVGKLAKQGASLADIRKEVDKTFG
jgi:hypothetical protein